MPENIEPGPNSQEKEPLNDKRFQEINELFEEWDKKWTKEHRGEDTPSPEEIAKEIGINIEEYSQFLEQTDKDSDEWYKKYRDMKGLTKE